MTSTDHSEISAEDNNPSMDFQVYMTAVIELLRGVGREGPGDEQFSLKLMESLPPISDGAPIADMGCGSGGATLPLAEYFQRKIVGIDLSPVLTADLRARAQERGLSDFVRTQCADFASLPRESHLYSLIWSEGAAYILTFAGALKTWKPLLVDSGLMVISELSWWSETRPPKIQEFWQQGYPEMSDEAGNVSQAIEQGLEVLDTFRLPNTAWWENYYSPILQRAADLESSADDTMKSVIADFRHEADIFARSEESYGYTFYVLKRRT